MNPKLLSILLIVATLALGVILGAVGNGAISNKRMNQISKIRTPSGFSEYVMKNIDPTSDDQRAEVEQILSDYGAKYRSLREQHGSEIRILGDSMMTEFSLVLSEDQMTHLREALSKSRKRREKTDHRRRDRRDVRIDSAEATSH